MPPRRELEVQAAWHQQASRATVHASKVTTLAFSGGAGGEDDKLWCGCDAAAPKPVEEDGEEPPIAKIRCLDGEGVQLEEKAPACNVRLLLPHSDAEGVLCVTGDGALLTLNGNGGVQSSTGLPGMPAAAAASGGSQKDGSAACQAAESNGGAGEPEAEQQAGGDAGTDGGGLQGPEFVAEAGYRGHREGYLYREGALGSGYYRKDVVRRHCPVVGPPPPPKPATAAAASGAGSELNGEAARQYIQRLLKAPPSMHSIVADVAAGLLFTSSLGRSDCSIRVWRLQLGGSGSSASSGGASGGGSSGVQAELHRTLTGHTAAVLSLALSPDGRHLYSGSHDHTVRAWSTSDWHCVRVLKGHGGGVRALAVAPDGTTLYSAAADNTIRAWSTEHWVCLRTMHGRHEDTTWPACLALSPDGSLLASGSTGPFGASTIKVFQTGSGGGREAGSCLASVAQLGYHQKGGISALLFSSTGGVLYSGASDGTVAVWRLGWRDPAAAGSGAGFRRGFL